MLRAAAAGQGVGVVELLAAGAVPAEVALAVEVAGRRAPAPDLLDRGPVPRVGARAEEVVVGEAERVGERPEARRVAGDEARRRARRRRAAACAFFAACSSVPVRSRTARPRARAWRASTSVCTYSSACPRCGAPLTNGMAVVRYRRSGIGRSSLARREREEGRSRRVPRAAGPGRVRVRTPWRGPSFVRTQWCSRRRGVPGDLLGASPHSRALAPGHDLDRHLA